MKSFRVGENEQVNTGNIVVWKGQVINNMCINTSYFKPKNHIEYFSFQRDKFVSSLFFF